MAVREDVVDAIVAVFDSGNAEGAPADATAEERQEAAAVIDKLLVHAPVNPAQLARKALIQAWRPGDDWDDMFDRLTAEQLTHLRALFPFLPARPARHFAERFIIPGR